jgi:hypothetical protein
LLDKETTVEGEWLDGKPHGICLFENEGSRGVMTFTNGNPYGAPYWIESKVNGKRFS